MRRASSADPAVSRAAAGADAAAPTLGAADSGRAADSRTSTGAYIANRVSDKITAVESHIFVCRSGSAADTQAVSDYVTYFLDQVRARARAARTPALSPARPGSARPARLRGWRPAASRPTTNPPPNQLATTRPHTHLWTSPHR